MIFGVLSFLNIPEVYDVEYLIHMCFGFLVVMILLSYVNQKSYSDNLLLIYTSFSMLNILYVYLYSPNWFLVPNFLISFIIFSNVAFVPKCRRKPAKVFTIERAYSAMKEPKEMPKIFIEDAKGNKTDIETAIKTKEKPKRIRKPKAKTATTKKKTTKKVAAKKTAPKKKSSKKKTTKNKK